MNNNEKMIIASNFESVVIEIGTEIRVNWSVGKMINYPGIPEQFDGLISSFPFHYDCLLG